MISPRAFRLLVRYLDAVDQNVCQGLLRIRPWTETALTSLLVDLLDERTTHQYSLTYSFADLLRELSAESNLFAVSLRVDTVEYPPELENRVTQSDVGLILSYRDSFRPSENWEAPFLLQAKRLTPDLHADLKYRLSSRFGSVDNEQAQRIVALNQLLGGEFVKYLFYCPRPSGLDDEMRTALTYGRVSALEGAIFDYLTGLETRDDLLRDDPTLAAGIFIANPSNLPETLMQCHSRVLQTAHPFSWFIARTFGEAHPHHRLGRHRPGQPNVPPNEANADPRTALGVLRGEKRAIKSVLAALGDDGGDAPRLAGAFLPQHVMTISFTVAPKLTRSDRNVAEL